MSIVGKGAVVVVDGNEKNEPWYDKHAENSRKIEQNSYALQAVSL